MVIKGQKNSELEGRPITGLSYYTGAWFTVHIWIGATMSSITAFLCWAIAEHTAENCASVGIVQSVSKSSHVSQRNTLISIFLVRQRPFSGCSSKPINHLFTTLTKAQRLKDALSIAVHILFLLPSRTLAVLSLTMVNFLLITVLPFKASKVS